MPSGLIEQDDGMCARRDVEGDLLEVHAHRFAVAAGHDDAGGLALGRADRAEQPCRCPPLILGRRGAGAAPGPAPGELGLLTNAGLVLPPQLYRRSSRTRVIAGLESDLSQPLEGRGVGAMSGEIRSYVHSLPEGQRMGFIQKAIEAGDERTVGAVLGGVPYLSGITPEMATMLLRLYHEKTNPRAAKQLRAAKAGLELIGERGGLLFGEMEKAVGAKQAKVQKLRAAKAAAEKSFVV
jgi:hypothetical protein